MTTLNKTIMLVVAISSMTTIYGQSTDKLHKIWELASIEQIGIGVQGLGQEMKRLDMRNEAQLVFGKGQELDTISYKVIDREIRLFDKEGYQLGEAIIWKIEHLGTDEFTLLFLARTDQKELTRLKYRAKD